LRVALLSTVRFIGKWKFIPFYINFSLTFVEREGSVEIGRVRIGIALKRQERVIGQIIWILRLVDLSPVLMNHIRILRQLNFNNLIAAIKTSIRIEFLSLSTKSPLFT
jgi:hypothetical protein